MGRLLFSLDLLDLVRGTLVAVFSCFGFCLAMLDCFERDCL